MQALAPMGPLVFAPARAQALGPVRPPAAPSARTIQTTACVVEVFSCLLPQSSARKRVSGSGPCPLAILRHLANLQAPNALRQGIPQLLSEPSAALPSLRYPCLRHASLIPDRDNACACPGHL